MKQINSLIIVLFLLSIHTTNSQTYNQILIGTHGNGYYYSSNLDGSNLLKITANQPSLYFNGAVDSPAESKIYMSASTGIFVMDYNGSNLQQLYSDPLGSLTKAIDIHFSTNKIYFINPALATLFSMNMDGTGLTAIITGLSTPRDLVIDNNNNHIYYCAQVYPEYGIHRVNMDGTGDINILQFSLVTNFSIDFINSKIYHSSGYGLNVSDLDGSNNTYIPDMSFEPGEIAIDNTTNLLYIAHQSEVRVITTNLDGSNPQPTIDFWGVYSPPEAVNIPHSLVLINNPTLGTEIVEPAVNNLVLHPNPSNNFFKISGLKQPKQYSLYNILGVEITNGVVSNNEKINIEHLKVGLYFLKFKNGNTLKITKI